MASDFAILFADWLHFGSHPGYFDDETICPSHQLGSTVTFVGASKTISFETPNVDSGQSAVFMYRSFDVTTPRNVIALNDREIPSGIPLDTSRCEWKSNLHILAPGLLAKDRANRLYVEALGESVETESSRDNFLLASAVIFYKTLD